MTSGQPTTREARLIETANTPIFSVDVNRRVTEWNQTMVKITGMPCDKVLGQELPELLLDVKARDTIDSVLNDALNGCQTANFEMRFNCYDQDGSHRGVAVLLFSATTRLDSAGTIVGVVSIGQDITQHKSLEDWKMTFMATISRELCSPIHSICGLTEVLVQTEEDPEREKKLSMIKNCSIRLLDLVTDILETSALRSANMQLNKAPCNFASLVEETVHMLHNMPDSDGKPIMHGSVKLVNKLEKNTLPIIEVDVHRCTQVLHKLLMNALKFTHKGEVSISGEYIQRERTVQIRVADTGIGIAPEHLDRIFEPFDQGNTGSFNGLGVGLALAHYVVERHGGTIKVQSKVGEGSEFTVNLPSDVPEMLKQPTTIGSLPGCGGTGGTLDSLMHMESENGLSWTGRGLPASTLNELPSLDCLPSVKRLQESLDRNRVVVLSVSDDMVNHEVVQAILGHKDFIVITAIHGGMALEEIELAADSDKLPNLVLLDSSTSGMTGHDICTALRSRFTPLELPIIMITSRSNAEEVAAELRNGCNDCVSKPFDSVDFSARILRQIELGREHKKLSDALAKLQKEQEGDAAGGAKLILGSDAGGSSFGADGPLEELDSPLEVPDLPRPRVSMDVRPISAPTDSWSAGPVSAPTEPAAPTPVLRCGSTATAKPRHQGRSATGLSLVGSVESAASSALQHSEKILLRRRVRELERSMGMMRAELAGSTAKLACVEGELEELWSQQSRLERQQHFA